MSSNYYSAYAADVILEVIFIATLIGIFFFTYASYIEKLVVEDQVDFIVQDMATDLKAIPQVYRNAIKSYMNTVKSSGTTPADKAVEKHNSVLMMKAIKVIGVGLVIGLVIVALLAWFFPFNIKDVGIKVALLLVFVGLTEFCFLTYLSRYFKSGDPNFVKRKILENLNSLKPRSNNY